MFHRCISLQSNFGFPGLIGGVLMSPGASPFRNATAALAAVGRRRNGNQRPPTIPVQEDVVITKDRRVRNAREDGPSPFPLHAGRRCIGPTAEQKKGGWLGGSAVAR